MVYCGQRNFGASLRSIRNRAMERGINIQFRDPLIPNIDVEIVWRDAQGYRRALEVVLDQFLVIRSLAQQAALSSNERHRRLRPLLNLAAINNFEGKLKAVSAKPKRGSHRNAGVPKRTRSRALWQHRDAKSVGAVTGAR